MLNKCILKSLYAFPGCSAQTVSTQAQHILYNFLLKAGKSNSLLYGLVKQTYTIKKWSLVNQISHWNTNADVTSSSVCVVLHAPKVCGTPSEEPAGIPHVYLRAQRHCAFGFAPDVAVFPLWQRKNKDGLIEKSCSALQTELLRWSPPRHPCYHSTLPNFTAVTPETAWL